MGQERRQAMVALEELLVQLFETEELRRWMHKYFPEEVIHELPGEATSCAVTSHKAVGLLERRGLINDSLFDFLVEARGQRREEIDAVRVMTAQAAAARTSSMRRVGGKQNWERRYRVAVWWTLALMVAGILVHGYPGLDASRALEAQRNGVFSFVPIFHRSWIFPVLIMIAAASTIVFWRLSLRRQYWTKDER